MFIMFVGGLSTGFKVYGPFSSVESLEDFAACNSIMEYEWMPLTEPR
jgi:hypothetical protein